MQNEKEDFLKNKFIPLLSKLDPNIKGNWGVMDTQQMIEHFADALKNASGKLPLPSLAAGDQLEKNRAFLFSKQSFFPVGLPQHVMVVVICHLHF